MRWWLAESGHARQKALIYRSRFEEVWNSLPHLLILAALPGWGKRIWQSQCADFLSQTRPTTPVVWASLKTDIETDLDQQHRTSPTDLVYWMLDGRTAAAADDFWDRLDEVLRPRPWVRCVLATFDIPPPAAPTLVTRAPALCENELAFTDLELAGAGTLLASEGLLLHDMSLSHGGDRGCPYLIGTHIERLRARAGKGVWASTAREAHLHLLRLFDRQRAELVKGSIGQALYAGANFGAFSADLLMAEGLTRRQAKNAMERFAAVPLFASDIDDETGAVQFAWQDDVWEALVHGDGAGARLRAGLRSIRASGRIVAQLEPLLRLGDLGGAEDLIRENFHMFLLCYDQRSTALLDKAPLRPHQEPAAVLLRTERRLFDRGFTPALRTETHLAFEQLRRRRTDSLTGQLTQTGLLAFAAATAGRHDKIIRYLEHLRDLPNHPEPAINEADRTRIVGTYFLAYWAALQADRLDDAAIFGGTMQQLSRPSDTLAPFFQTSYIASQDLNGIRSLSPTGERPDDRDYTPGRALLDLEEGRDDDALLFLRPLLTQQSATSRSVVDALTLLVFGIAAPGELNVRFIEEKLAQSEQHWIDQRPSSLLVWASVVAFASIGAHDAARPWVTGLAKQLDPFATLARLHLALCDGDHRAAIEESGKTASLPRFRICSDVLAAVACLSLNQTERAALILAEASRDHPGPRLFRFALRLIPQRETALLEAHSRLFPTPVQQAIQESRNDNRPPAGAIAHLSPPARRRSLPFS